MRVFQREMEKEIVTVLFRDERSRPLLPQVKADYFYSDHYKTLVRNLQGFEKKFKGLPESRRLFKRYLFDTELLGEEEQEEYSFLISGLYKRKELHPATTSYIRADILNTLKQNAFFEIRGQMEELIETYRFDDIIKLCRRANEIGISNKGIFNMAKDLPDFLADFAERAKKKGISTGIPKLDNTFLSGYVPFGAMTLLLAPTNRGKTFWLCNQAANSYMAGFNVLYITMEDGITGINARIVPTVAGSGITARDLIDDPGVILAAVKRRTSRAGNLFVETYPAGKTTTDFIAQRITRYSEMGKDIDHVIVDYLSCVAPSSHSPEKEDVRLGLVAQELRSIAEEFDVRLDTAGQINREGSKKKIPRLEDIAGAYAIAHHVDVAIILGQDDDQYKNGTGLLVLDKNRIGTKKVAVDVIWDAEKLEIRQKGA